jgi:Fur family zinc uptake transcriptional regulator
MARRKDVSDTRLKSAERHCIERGIVVTALRRQILQILAAADGPVGAYAILDELARSRRRPIGPPTVYRTLDLLAGIGCVVKIESHNTFALCGAPGHQHHGMMLICTHCGRADEVDSGALDRIIRETAGRTGFHLERQVVELEGICQACREDASPLPSMPTAEDAR